MAPIGYSRPFAKLIYKQNQKLKISCQAPFINFTYGDLCPSWKLNRDEMAYLALFLFLSGFSVF
jgi:hypothetical protein